MKKNNEFIVFSELIVLIIIMGVIYIQSIGMEEAKHKNNQTVVAEQSHYIIDCERILGYEKGLNVSGKKRMILSTAAKYYYDEECVMLDGTLPVVNVEFLEDYRGYELYWISQGNPSDFFFNKQVTNIECMGNYSILYCIKDQPTITQESIRQMGFNDRSDFLINNEFSWFLLIDPVTATNVLVKNALTDNDCFSFFDNYIQERTKSRIVASVVVKDLQSKAAYYKD